MIDWSNFQYIALFALLPFFILLSLNFSRWKKKVVKVLASTDFIDSILNKHAEWKYTLSTVFWFLSFSLMIIGLMGPLFGAKQTKVKKEGLDIVYAIDVSKSMDAEDLAPSRLEKAKMIVRLSLDKLAGDRTSLIVFAGHSFTLLPLSTDYTALNLYLDNLNSDLVSMQGTNYSLAIGEALKNLQSDNISNVDRVMIILSDGENHEENLKGILNEALDKKIRVFTIGIGTEKGAPIPIKEFGRVIDYKLDKNGNKVISKLNSKLMKEISLKTKGEYFEAKNVNEIVHSLHQKLNTLQKSDSNMKHVAEKKEQYQWAIGFSIFFLFLNLLLSPNFGQKK